MRISKLGALAFGISLSLASGTARADATVGLWPDVSVPPTSATPDPKASQDAALVIGIDRYDALPRVVGAADNARDWEKYFLFGRHVPPERVALLTDQNATVEAIKQRASELAAKVPPGGTMFVVFIGHGAPAQGGQKGLLLGADVRPSDSSFASRSVAYDELETTVAGGTQAKTVMILDACFSGIDAGGRTLLPNVQPIVATSLIANAKTTVFSAGTAAEYAGALPGSQRPALSYLLLGALRGWGDTDGDGNVTAAEAHAYASLVLRSMPNNHAQHPQIVTDVPNEILGTGAKEHAPDLAVIRSKLDSWAPPVEKKAQPELRIAVGCGDKEPRGTDDGLEVFLDDSPTPAAPIGGDRLWNESEKRNVIRYISYPTTPGNHHLLVRIPGCKEESTSVMADTTGAEVHGVLRSNSSLLTRGPAGAPNGFRIAAGFWMPRTFAGAYAREPSYAAGAENAYGDLQYGISAKGLLLQPALAFRWWTLGVDFGIADGDASRQGDVSVSTAAINSATNQAHVSWIRAGMRAGARFPFNVAALSLGIAGGYDNVLVDNTAPGTSFADQRSNAYFGGFATVDIQALCDWPVYVGLNMEDRLGREAVGMWGLVIGAAYQPSSTCKVERSTKYELTQQRQTAKR